MMVEPTGNKVKVMVLQDRSPADVPIERLLFSRSVVVGQALQGPPLDVSQQLGAQQRQLYVWLGWKPFQVDGWQLLCLRKMSAHHSIAIQS